MFYQINFQLYFIEFFLINLINTVNCISLTETKMNISSNSTNKIDNFELISYRINVFLYWTSFISNIFVLIVICLSRNKLIRTELCILIVLISNDLINKLCNSINITIYICFTSVAINKYLKSAIDVVVLFSDCEYSLTLFYYSIHQVSTISRAKLFTKLFYLSHKLKRFLIFYFICAVILAIALVLWTINNNDISCTASPKHLYFHYIHHTYFSFFASTCLSSWNAIFMLF